MVVITLTHCPDALRGDLTKWLLEVNVGVFVGQIGARVRERLWERVVAHVRDGRATMVFSASNEQRLDFRVANSEWRPVDFDGIRLILRPSSVTSEQNAGPGLAPGYSLAARRLKARRMAGRAGTGGRRATESGLKAYVVFDVETTGLSPEKDEVMELSAVKVFGGEITGRYSALIRIAGSLPVEIVSLTGITEEMLRTEGRDLRVVLGEFLSFIGTEPLVAHNSGFDWAFVRAACNMLGITIPQNRIVDTLVLARRFVRDVGSHNLSSLAHYFGFPVSPAERHRGLNDCLLTKSLYEKLMDFD